MISLLLGYVVINLITFFTYGIDKQKARKNEWRISEARLICLAAIGGGLGAWFGMKFFHHKTKHMKFRILVPLFIILHLILLGYICSFR